MSAEGGVTEYERGYLQALLDYSWAASTDGERYVGNSVYPVKYENAVNRLLGPGHTVTFHRNPPSVSRVVPPDEETETL